MTLPLWLFAQDLSSTRSFVIRTEAPRFIAEIVEERNEEAVLGTLVYAAADGQALLVTWIDPPPNKEETRRLLAAAARFVADYDSTTDLMTNDGLDD